MNVPLPEGTTALKNRDQILEELSTIENLPTLPTIFLNVMTLMRNPAAPIKKIAEAVESDPAITMKILKLINSSFYGLARSVDSVHQAIVLLGSNTLKNVVISVSIFRAMGDTEEQTGFDRNALWQHSIATGLIARYLEKKLHIGKSEEGFIAGVIHDIGKIILDKFFTVELSAVMKKVRQDGVGFYQAEIEVLGIAHDEIGATLAEQWKLPDDLIAVIANHHQIDPEAESNYYPALIQVSDMLARQYKIGSGGDDLIPEVEPETWTILNLTPQMLDEWREEIQAELDKSKETFEALKQ